MRIALAMLFLAGCAQAPIALRDMGSFHVGEHPRQLAPDQ
jgi:hypothetical protein